MLGNESLPVFTPADHTFVLCGYKESPYIEQALESLERQSVKTSILLSTSTPNDYLKDLCERHGVPMVVNTGKSGLGEDWNFGYDKAETKLVTIAHQDDLYSPDFAKRVLEVANRCDEGKLQLLYTDYYELRNGQRVEDNRLLKIKRIMNAPMRIPACASSVLGKRLLLSFGDPICCPSVTLHKPVAGKSAYVTGYANSSDYRTWVKYALRPGRFVYIPEILMGHRIYAGSTTTKNLAENVRKKEDLEVLSGLWPKPIAALINRAYATSEKSNEVQ